MPHAGLTKRWRYQVTSRVNEAYRAGELRMPTRQDAPTWRERWAARTGIDPLVCPRCRVEMVFIEHCFGPHAGLYARLGLAPGERIEYRDTA